MAFGVVFVVAVDVVSLDTTGPWRIDGTDDDDGGDSVPTFFAGMVE